MSALGLSPHQETAYRLALAEPSWLPADLAAHLTAHSVLSAAEADTAVRELTALALLRRTGQDEGGALRVVSPAVGLTDRLEGARQAVRQRQRDVDEAAGLLVQLQDRYSSAREAHLEQTIERLTGLDAIRSRLEQLARDARYEASAFLQGPQTPESMAASAPLDEALLARGVRLRGIHQHSAVNDPTTLAYLRWLTDLGAEVRTVATLPLQMIIMDREIALVPIDVERQSAGAQLVRGSGILTAMIALFESTWAGARPVGERRRPDVSELSDTELSDTEREILRILSTGATDEAVARQLAVSVRTVRRLTSTLMTRYGAQSRFELGLKLGRSGSGVARA